MDKIIYFLAVALCCANAVQIDTSSTRITNGNLAAESQFRYAISLQQLSQLQTQTRGHRCGGALITLQHVLTTSSCLQNRLADGSTVLINAGEYRVFAGSVLLTNDTSVDRIRTIANFTLHPEYTGHPAYVNDIAIITLTLPFPSTSVTPIALPPTNHDPVDFALCTVAGWGATNLITSASVNLRYANKYIYNQPLCTVLYNTAPSMLNILPSMVCAASFDIVSSGCINDEGNALVCNQVLTGILSITDLCSASSYPEIYTRVTNYNTWINRITSSASNFTPGLFIVTLLTLMQALFH